MRLKITELEMIYESFSYEAFSGTPSIIVSPQQIVNFTDIINNIKEAKKKPIQLSPHSKENITYPLLACVTLLNEVISENKNIRSYTTYNHKEKDFLLDFEKLYYYYFKEFQLNNWHIERKELLDPNNKRDKCEAQIDPSFLEHMINKQLQHMCNTVTGTIVAAEWVVQFPKDKYQLPASAESGLRKQPWLGLKEYNRLIDRIKGNRPVKKRKGPGLR